MNFLPLEESKELAELGFDETTFGIYNDFQFYELRSDLGIQNSIPAPLFQQAFRFFREKYGYHSWVTMELGYKKTFCWVLSGEHISTQYSSHFETYEQAEIECIRELIKIKKLI